VEAATDSDQKIDKQLPIFIKVAKIVAKPKNVKISTSKLSLKVWNIYDQKTFETLKYQEQACVETANLR